MPTMSKTVYSPNHSYLCLPELIFYLDYTSHAFHYIGLGANETSYFIPPLPTLAQNIS